ILSLVQLLPAVAVGLAAAIGFQLSAPALEAIVWPEEPDLSAIAEDSETLSQQETEAVVEELLAQGVGDFEDGVYYGSGTGFSGITQVEVVVENRQIVQINILSYQDDDSFFNRARAVIDSVLTAQTWEVDTVSGATYSSRGILEAVKNALNGTNELSEAADTDTTAAELTVSSYDDSATWADGTYTGSARGFGGTIKVQVTIKDGKITAIQVLSHSGETASYFSKAKAIISRILKAQSPNVDTVSGATYSSTGIREAVKAALKKAAGQSVSALAEDEENDQTETETNQEITLPEGAPADGSYTGTGECTKFGYSVTLTAVFQNGVLTALEDFTLVDNDDEDNEPFAASAWAGMKTNLLSGSTDVVSGATYSSNAILAAYQDAYAQAVAAGGGTVDTTNDADDSDDTQSGDADEETDENEDNSGTQDEEQSADVLLADGTYTASALCEPDEYEDFEAYTLTADVTFEGGKLVSIDNLTSTDDSNVKYYTRAAEGTSKYTGVVAQLIDKQSSADIDVVSNATCSSVALVAIYEDAYAQAVAAAQTEDEGDSDSGETDDSASSDLTGTPADGTYTASALCEPDEYEDFEAYTLTADVTFEGGKLVSIDNLTSTDDSNVKYYTRAAEGTSKYTGVVAQLIDKQGSADIDAVSNATCSSVALVAIYEDTYAQAVAANSQVTATAVDTDEETETEEAEPEEITEEETAEETSAEENSTEETEAAEAEEVSETTDNQEQDVPAEQEAEESVAEPAAKEEPTAGDDAAAEETSPQSEKEDAEE
ncbi:MAG: FMN-binding protein, partial [Clostridiales bacterium]|nr:FMN-binding protein [Clostridiales bacterium]